MFENNRMSDDELKKYNEFFKEEHDKLMEAENEKAFLKDKSIGGHAPRPSDRYIDECLGEQKTTAEIADEAGKKADERLKQYRRDLERESESEFKAEVERSQSNHMSFDDAVRENIGEERYSEEFEKAITAERQEHEHSLSRHFNDQSRERTRD